MFRSNVVKGLLGRTSIRRPFQTPPRCSNRIPGCSSSRSFHTTRIQLAMKDPYKSLGLDKNASSKDIKKAYYQLAKKFHPDVNKEKGSDEQFQDIQNAYEVLSDENKKKQYDQFGAAAFEQGGAAGNSGGGGGGDGPFNPFGNFSGFEGFNFGGGSAGGAHGFNFEDIFGAFADMGGAGGRGRGRGGGAMHYKGDDIEVLAHVTLEDAASGKTVQVKYTTLDECGTCHGSGLKSGKQKSTCQSCGGTGSQVHLMQGGFQMASTCATCKGSGVVIPRGSGCDTCGSQGVVQASKNTQVDIPPGIADGMRLKVAGAGDAPPIQSGAGVHRSNGDLYVRVRVKPHNKFQRSKSDLLYSVQIPMTTAALGGKIEIPTLLGRAIGLNIPQATQHGSMFTIPEQGLPLLNRKGVHGDLKVTVNVKTLRPSGVNQTALLEALARETGDKTAKITNPPPPPPTEGGEHHSDMDADDSNSHQHKGFLKNLFNKMTHHNDDKSNNETNENNSKQEDTKDEGNGKK